MDPEIQLLPLKVPFLRFCSPFPLLPVFLCQVTKPTLGLEESSLDDCRFHRLYGTISDVLRLNDLDR